MAWICWAIICLWMKLSCNLLLLVLFVILDGSWSGYVGQLSVLG